MWCQFLTPKSHLFLSLIVQLQSFTINIAMAHKWFFAFTSCFMPCFCSFGADAVATGTRKFYGACGRMHLQTEECSSALVAPM